MPAGEDVLAALLAGSYVDPDGGGLLVAPSRRIAIEESLIGREVELVRGLGLGPRLGVVDDERTCAVMGERVAGALAAAFDVVHVTLPDPVEPDEETIARISSALRSVNAVVAVGSGVINDLCKMTAVRLEVPQVVFATAPSMNGYTSVSASIAEDGFKRSLRAQTPVGAFFDLTVLAAAPARMIRAGLGDSMCRTTAQADWLMSHLVLGTAYREAPFAMLAADEAAVVADPSLLLRADLAAMRSLVRLLVLSGFGMTICGGSFPASQGEHLISHYAELMLPGHSRESLHGEQTAVAAVAMARLQDDLLAREEPPVLRPLAVTRADLVGRFGEHHGESAWRQLEAKRLSEEATAAVNAKLAAEWDAIRARVSSVCLGVPRLQSIFAAAGVPSTAESIGWPPGFLDDALTHAWMIRDRYTFLDLAASLGA